MTTNSWLRRLGMGVGLPLALTAVLGTGLVLAQQGDDGGTETPSATETVPTETTPSGDTTPTTPDDGKGTGRHSGDGCPKDGADGSDDSGDSSDSDAAVRSAL